MGFSQRKIIFFSRECCVDASFKSALHSCIRRLQNFSLAASVPRVIAAAQLAMKCRFSVVVVEKKRKTPNKEDAQSYAIFLLPCVGVKPGFTCFIPDENPALPHDEESDHQSVQNMVLMRQPPKGKVQRFQELWRVARDSMSQGYLLTFFTE